MVEKLLLSLSNEWPFIVLFVVFASGAIAYLMKRVEKKDEQLLDMTKQVVQGLSESVAATRSSVEMGKEIKNVVMGLPEQIDRLLLARRRDQ